jgi:hypothetical protein
MLTRQHTATSCDAPVGTDRVMPIKRQGTIAPRYFSCARSSANQFVFTRT